MPPTASLALTVLCIGMVVGLLCLIAGVVHYTARAADAQRRINEARDE